MWKFVFIAPVPRTFSVSFHFGHDGIVQLGQAVCGSPHHLRIAPFDSPFGQYISYPHVLCLPFSRRGPSLHGRCPASPLLRPHPTTALAYATGSSPKFPCRTFETRRLLCPAALTLPKSSRRGDVGFTNTEALTTRKHLTRLYVGSSLALRLVSLSGKTPAHRSPSARLAVLIVCRFLYDIAPSAISSAELCLAYLCHNSPRAVSQFPLRHLSTPSIEHAFIKQPTILHLDLLYHQGYTAWVSARPSGSSWDFALD